MEDFSAKLETALKIPVHNNVDFYTYAEVLYDNQNLGKVYITNAPLNRIIDTSPEVVNKLRWDVVYLDNQELLDGLVVDNFPEYDNLKITIGTFRHLYVKDSDGILLGSAECQYSDEEWSVWVTKQNL